MISNKARNIDYVHNSYQGHQGISIMEDSNLGNMLQL